jgi:ankyrin repeat protein
MRDEGHVAGRVPHVETAGARRRVVGPVGVVAVVAVVLVVAVSFFMINRGPAPTRTATSCVSSDDPLVRAASSTQAAQVRSLLEQGHDANAPDPLGRRPLYCAVASGDTEPVQVLLDKGASPNLDSTDDGYAHKQDRPLNLAIVKRSAALVSLLLDHGADVNATTTGRSPLGLTIEYGDVDAVLVLLDHGADPNLLDGTSPPLYEASAIQPDAHIVSLLLDRGANARLTAGSGGCLDLSAALNGNEGCATPLGAAAQYGHGDTVVVLLAHGADPTAGLYPASIGNHPDIARTLLDRGANPNGLKGTTPLVYNVMFGNQPLVDLLLERGADPNVGGEASASTLQTGAALAKSFGSGPVATDRQLMPVACAIRASAPNLPPIVVAAATGNTDAIRSLLARGADPNAVAAFDPPVSPLVAAITAHHEDIAEMLEGAGAQRSGPTIDPLAKVSPAPEFCT